MESVLEQNDLDSLVNEDLPSPDEQYPKFAIWKKASKQVKTSLLSHLRNDIMDELRTPSLDLSGIVFRLRVEVITVRCYRSEKASTIHQQGSLQMH